MTERQEHVLCFDCSKREIFTPNSGLKALRRKLQSNFKITAYACAPGSAAWTRARTRAGARAPVRAVLLVATRRTDPGCASSAPFAGTRTPSH